MAHTLECTLSRQGRENLSDIIRYGYNPEGELVFIAAALQDSNLNKTYFCPCDNCRVEMVPKRSSDKIPIRTKSGDVLGYRRAHFASLPNMNTRGPIRERKTQQESAIEQIASQLRSSGLYTRNSDGLGTVYTGGKILIEMDREKATRNYPQGWGEFAVYDADIVAMRGLEGIVIQVEGWDISKRYGSFEKFLTRIRRLADDGSDKRKRLLFENGKSVELPSVYQAVVVLNNYGFLTPHQGRTSLTPTGTMLKRLFDDLYVFEPGPGNLLTVESVVEKTDQAGYKIPFPEFGEPLIDFGFTERMYCDGRLWKRYEERRVLSGSRVLIPKLKVAAAQEVVYNCDKEPVNLEANGQCTFSFAN